MIIGHKGTGRAVGSILAVDSPKLSAHRLPDAGWAPTISILLRAFLALAAGAAATWFIVHRIPRALHAQTDIVGATTFTNFPVDYYLTAFNCVVFLFPAATLTLFLAATWVAGRLGMPAGFGRVADTTAIASMAGEVAGRPRLVAAARVAATGSVLGLEAAILGAVSQASFWQFELMAVAIYGLVVAAVAVAWSRAAGRGGFPFLETARVNAGATVLTLIGMLAASGGTTVTILQTGSEHHYDWLPLWVIASASGLAAVTIFSALRGASDVMATQRIERRALLVITASVGLFLVLSRIVGDLGLMDMFHEGEGLVPARLNALGYLPWRDVTWVHGLLEDTYRSQFGMLTLDNSRWGAIAGSKLVLFPLYAVSVYSLFVYLFRRNWPFLLLSLALPLGLLAGPDVLNDWIFDGNRVRFILWPPILLLLAAVLEKPAPGRMIAFSILLFVQLIVTPESAYTLPACAVVMVAFEAVAARRGLPITVMFRRTIWCSATGLMAGAAFLLFLAANHASADFFFYYRMVSEGHQYQSAIPFSEWLSHSQHPQFDRWAAAAPLVAMVLAVWYISACALRRRALSTADWIMTAEVVLVALYYPKFLTRMDGHVYHVYTIALPLLLYTAYRAVEHADTVLQRIAPGKAVARALSRHPVSLALLLLSMLFIPALPGRLAGVPAQYRAASATAPWNPRLGYAAADAVDRSLYSDLEQVLHAYVQPGDSVFDFANEPGLYYYLLGYLPPTRYYNVLAAMPEDVQQDVIGRLRSARPKFVVFDGGLGLPHWDGIPNMVRHYDISQYILDHYRPLVEVQGQILYVDAGRPVSPPQNLALPLSQPLKTEGLYFGAEECDWGYAPNFLSVTPHPVPGRAAAVVAAQSSGTSVQLELPPGAHWTDYEWLEIDAHRLVADTLRISDGGSGGQRSITFSTLADSPTKFLVRVGSCAQWHGYRDGPLTLSGTRPQDLSRVRVLP
jgi:hypothetical protein